MKYFLLTLLTVSLIGCGFGTDGESSKLETQADQIKSTEGGLFDTQLDALEKARSVEKTLQDAAERRRKEMEAQGI